MRQNIKKILTNQTVMQIATSLDDKPWVCSVYFVYDQKLNLYWLSEPHRRHSIEIKKNNNIAVTMAIKTDLPVIGLGAEGIVEIVNQEESIRETMKKYVAKYGSGENFLKKFKEGTNKHSLYKFTPKKYVIFDEVNFNNNKSIDFTL